MNTATLFKAIEDTAASLPYIPSSQNFWLNRTNDGENYEIFYDNGIVGLDLNDLSLSEIANIRESNQLRNGRLRYDNVQTQIQRVVFEKRKKKIKSKPEGAKRSAELAKTTRIANQIYNFVFEMKSGDYVVIPSKESRRITIGRIENNYLENSEHIHLTKKVKWEKTLFKPTLDPFFYKLFFTQHSFANIQKYKDVVLRSLYDFYVDDDRAHFVLNVNASADIGAWNEAAFNYHFLLLLEDFIRHYNLPYNVADIKTKVNLNSPGKRKIFGPKTTIFLAACMFTVIFGGGVIYKKGSLSVTSSGVSTIIKSWSDFLNEQKRREIADELIRQSDSLDIQKQELMIKLLHELDTQKE